jgi:hypothetical protein
MREQKLVRAYELVELMKLEVDAANREKARFLEKAIESLARRCISRRAWTLKVVTLWHWAWAVQSSRRLLRSCLAGWAIWSERAKAARAFGCLSCVTRALADCMERARDMENAAEMLLALPMREESIRPSPNREDDAQLGPTPPRRQQILPLLKHRYQQTIFSEISWFDLYPKTLDTEICWRDAQAVVELLTEHCADVKSIYRYYALHSLPKKDRRTFGVTGSQWLVRAARATTPASNSLHRRFLPAPERSRSYARAGIREACARPAVRHERCHGHL